MSTLDIIALGLVVNATLLIFDFVTITILLAWPRHREVQAQILLYVDRIRTLRKSGRLEQTTLETIIATIIPFARIILTFKMLRLLVLAKFHPVTYIYLLIEEHKNRFGD